MPLPHPQRPSNPREGLFTMKFALGPAVGIALACVALTACDQKAPENDAGTTGVTVATVNGDDIHQSDVDALYNNLPPQYRQLPIEFLQEQLVSRLIEQKLMVAQAKADGIEKDEKYKERLELAKETALEEVWITKQIDAKLSPERLKTAYDEMVASFKPATEYKASHILVKTEEEGKAIIDSLNGGADFATLAREKSLDPGSGAAGGDLGDFFSPDKMVPEFSQAVTALKPGEVSKTPVKSQYGWHVIKVVETRQSSPPAQADVEAQIKDSERDKVVEEIISELRGKAKIEKPKAEGETTGHEDHDAPAAPAAPAPATPAEAP